MKGKKSVKVNKEPKEKRRWLKRLLSVLLVIAVLAAVGYIVLDSMTDEGQTVIDLVHDAMESEVVKTDKFAFDAYSDNVFDELNGGLIAVSASAYQVLDNTGEIVGRGTKAFVNPAMSSGEGGAVIWSQGGNDIMLLAPNGATKIIDSENTVIAASVNDSGYVAVTTEQSGYKGLVTVYDGSGDAVYKWFSGSAYLLDAAVNKSNTAMTALSVSDKGSRVVSYLFGSEEEQGAYSEDTIFFDMDYISENRICLVADNKAVFVNGKCEYNSEYSFDGWYLKDYSLEGNGFAVFVLSKYKTSGEIMLVSVDAGGDVLGSVTTMNDVNAISVRGRYIAVTYADSAVLYSSDFTEVGVVENAAGTEKALASADGKLIAVSANGAVEYDF